jgi:RNA polymerase sigma-70 factor (ECF subfamily)
MVAVHPDDLNGPTDYWQSVLAACEAPNLFLYAEPYGLPAEPFCGFGPSPRPTVKNASNFPGDTQNSPRSRYVIGQVMLESDNLASRILPQHFVAMGREDVAEPMTLNEKVIAHFEQLRVPVFRYLIRKTHDTGRAEELTQEAFLRLCRHLQEGRTLENPKAWLFTVANNLAIDTKRNNSNIADLDQDTWKEIEECRSGSQIDPEKLMLQDERLDRLHVAMLNLTKLQRECLHLRAEGLRYREIAELMKISISTVADAVRRATVKLAREVDSEASA